MTNLTPEEWAAKVWEREGAKGSVEVMAAIRRASTDSLFFLEVCFTWGDSPEGHNFWLERACYNIPLTDTDRAKLTALLALHEQHKENERCLILS